MKIKLENGGKIEILTEEEKEKEKQLKDYFFWWDLWNRD